ncbi:MAG: bifunctional metallophosphatase/5'-nucleotidase [Bacteroidetes bacterium]|nr:bifunctional metallophosphatase/5'-nucleotidase [Bacteroidota bacterium]
MRKYLLYSILAFTFSSCHLFKDSGKSVRPDNVVIKIVQINDVYEIDAINNGKNGGLARVAYISDSIKKQNPNTWFFLAGDFVNPSLLGTIKVNGERLQGKQMVDVLNHTGLDLVTFGNHEFDLKEADLQKRMNESNFKWTSANTLQIHKDGSKAPFAKTENNNNTPVSDYEIFKASNAKGQTVNFGVVSTTINSNPKDYVYYGDVYEEAKRAYNILSPKTDFVLGLTHISIDQDKELARQIPNIPLIMGGHEHNNMLHKVGKTIIAKADANVVSLYVHTLKYNTKKHKLKINSELVKVTDAYPSKPEVQSVVDKWNIILDQNLKAVISNPDEVVYDAIEPLDGTDFNSRNKQTNLGNIICKSMAYAYSNNVDGAFTNGGSIRIDDRLSGHITAKDIFRILPFGGSALLVEMKGELLKRVLEFGQHAAGAGAYLQRDNITQNNLGEWLIQNTILDPEKTYRIAMGDYLLLGLDIPFLKADTPGIIKVSTPKENELAGDVRKSIIQYFKSLKP